MNSLKNQTRDKTISFQSGNESETVGVPEKGRNAGVALSEELERDDVDEILDVLNGEGKEAAKTGKNFRRVEEKAKSYNCVELKDTGRRFPRPVFTDYKNNGQNIESFTERPLEKDFQTFYRGFDLIIEEHYDEQQINKGFEQLAQQIVDERDYNLERTYGDRVKWAAMNTDLDEEPETVLIPEEFPSIGKAAAQKYWGGNTECQTFQEYKSENDLQSQSEEKTLRKTPESTSGVYMYVSGKTARAQNLQYEPITGFESQLGKFQKS